MAAGHAYLWEFIVDPARTAEFLGHYRAGGTWAELFRRSPGYLGTLLLRDPGEPNRFVTVDRWQTAEAYAEFRTAFAREYAELDARCEHLTLRETSLGHYDEEAA